MVNVCELIEAETQSHNDNSQTGSSPCNETLNFSSAIAYILLERQILLNQNLRALTYPHTRSR